MIRRWPGRRTAVLVATATRRTAEETPRVRRWYSSLGANLIDWTNSKSKLKHDSVDVCENVVSEQEERALLLELDLALKRRRAETTHWDNVIKNYKEIEVLDTSWGSENIKTIQRLRYELQNNLKWEGITWLPVHVIDLAEDGEINRHVDSVKFSGGVVSGLSFFQPLL